MTAVTVYKTNQPEQHVHGSKPEDFARVEYYQFAVGRVEDDRGIRKPTVRVFHGWWDELNQDAKSNTQIFCAAYETEEEAEAAYKEQLSHYAGQGFIHAFMPTPWGGFHSELTP